MPIAFVATSYKHHEAMADVLDTLSHQLSSHGYTPLIFVRKYTFTLDQTTDMMQTSFRHIRECDLFIADLTHKVVGVGIEAGYAAAYKKPIIYSRHQTAKQSTTMTGIAQHTIVYHHIDDLNTKLDKILMRISTG